MNASNHVAVKAASSAGGIAAVIAVAEAARLASRAFGITAGAAVIGAVFAACWIIWRVRPMLHPVPLARRSGTREAEVTAEPAALAGTIASR
ncbi:MAG: hypothetical protein ACLQK8_24690 [Streptosporangiaceae bacterium]